VSSREERIAKNESVVREINEGIEAAKATDAPDGHVRMLCECGQEECNVFVAVTLAEYEQIRSDARTFLVAKGHTIADVEFVVAETDRFAVVQKREGTPAEVAETLDPRS
jgi:hypothetical protein